MEHALNDQALDTIFRGARTHNAWLDKPVGSDVLKKVYDLCKWGPTSANCSPMRIVFVISKEAKEKLKPHLAAGNVEKTMTAPVVAILGMDKLFYNFMPKLFPHTDAKAWFVGNQPLIEETAFRNSSLQGAYFMLAARAVGLDCGPMSGFNKSGVKAAFFEDQPSVEPNFICNVGYGDPSKLFPRSPRFDFDDICKIV